MRNWLNQLRPTSIETKIIHLRSIKKPSTCIYSNGLTKLNDALDSFLLPKRRFISFHFFGHVFLFVSLHFFSFIFRTKKKKRQVFFVVLSNLWKLSACSSDYLGWCFNYFDLAHKLNAQFENRLAQFVAFCSQSCVDCFRKWLCSVGDNC